MSYAAYTRSASIYDLIYSFKDYAAEVVKLTAILEQECPGARELLDVACGTAEHARLLVETPAGGSSDGQPVPTFHVDGVDLEPSFLEIARVKVPSGRFVVGDMADFDLGRRYDAVLCLFSAIGYLLDVPRLVSALRCFGRHLRPGGVALVEPWFTPDAWRVGSVHMQTAERDDLKVCRMTVSGREGKTRSCRFTTWWPRATEWSASRRSTGWPCAPRRRCSRRSVRRGSRIASTRWDSMAAVSMSRGCR